LTLCGRDADEPPLHVMLNASHKAQTFVIPTLADWSGPSRSTPAPRRRET
jgi:hypothetical protein